MVAAHQRETPQMVSMWRARFVEHRVDDLLDAPRSGAPRTIDDASRRCGDCQGTGERAAWGDALEHSRAMASATGAFADSRLAYLACLWLAAASPGDFQAVDRPDVRRKGRDIVGLCIAPPLMARVLCADEKSQIQALDRTQPLLPLAPPASPSGKPMTTSVMARPLDLRRSTLPPGRSFARCTVRHRSSEFLQFLRTVEAGVPAVLDIHLFMDNYGAHKTASIQSWLARHQRFHVHFTPTSASWPNQVERCFA